MKEWRTGKQYQLPIRTVRLYFNTVFRRVRSKIGVTSACCLSFTASKGYYYLSTLHQPSTQHTMSISPRPWPQQHVLLLPCIHPPKQPLPAPTHTRPLDLFSLDFDHGRPRQWKRTLATGVAVDSLRSKRYAIPQPQSLSSLFITLPFSINIRTPLYSIQERGASCALVGSLGINRNTDSFRANLRSARTASNSAISTFYGNACNKSSEIINMKLAAMLQVARQLVDGGMIDENKHLFFHDVVV